MDQRKNTENRNNERDGFKDRVNEGIDWLKATEDRARGLANQNLADIAAAARGRLQQLRDHPDVDMLHDEKLRNRVERRDDRTEYKDPHPSTAAPANGTQRPDAQRMNPPPFDPKAGAAVQQSPAFTFNAPGSQVGGPDQGKEGVHTPGEPRFDNSNAGFQQPNAVDLNADGTLRQAPNSKGAPLDVREDGAGQK